jgi:hypothetical protein
LQAQEQRFVIASKVSQRRHHQHCLLRLHFPLLRRCSS